MCNAHFSFAYDTTFPEALILTIVDVINAFGTINRPGKPFRLFVINTGHNSGILSDS
jgi:hypothetical protein